MIIAKCGLEAVLKLLLQSPVSVEPDAKQLLSAVVGLLLNLITDNADCHTKVRLKLNI